MLRILVIADSTSMWIRPYRNHKNEYTYVEYLRKEGMDVDVISTPGMTSKEVLEIYWNQLGASFYDYYIVSVGINDLTPRAYFHWMWKIDNGFVLKNSFITKFYGYFYRVFTNHFTQKIFSKYHVSRPWISQKEFALNLLKFKELILKESDSKIIYIVYPNVSKRIASIIHGIEKNQKGYREVFNSLVDNKRVFLLNIEKLFMEDREKYNVEGIHYTAEGHKKVFEALVKKIKALNEN